MLRKGLLTKAFRQMSIDKDREVKLSQLLLSINAVLAEMQARAPFMHQDTGEMVYHGSEQQVSWQRPQAPACDLVEHPRGRLFCRGQACS